MIPNYLAFGPDTNIFPYLGWGVFWIALGVFIILTLSLYYHWFVYEARSRVIQAGAIFYAIGSLLILLNVWRTFASLML